MNNEKLEKELRYILSDSQYSQFKENALRNLNRFKVGNALLETTIMFDNPNPALTFYSKEIDGRLRLRTSRPGHRDLFPNASSNVEQSMLTWKQRIPEYAAADIRIEREIEVHFDQEEADLMASILINVLKCPRVSSYERYRETFYTDNIEIASDTFPYGHVVELELKSGDESQLVELSEMLGLSSMSRSRLSCDDLYRLLCEKAGINSRPDILFDDDSMPQIGDYLGEIASYL